MNVNISFTKLFSAALILFLSVNCTLAKKNLAILVFDGVQVIDYSGPFEAFNFAWQDGEPYFNIYFVAQHDKVITCSGGLKILPDYTLENAPDPDYLIVPGGFVVGNPAAVNDTIVNWIRQKYPTTTITMSVCNGGTLLAKAGVLDDKKATSNAYVSYFKTFEQYCTNCKIVSERVTWSGNVITTGGVAAGIDGALSVIEKELGIGAAQEAALSMEYYWEPNSHTRSEFAEVTFLNTYYMLKGLEFKGSILKTEGDNKKWEKVFKLTDQSGIESLTLKILNSLADRDHWTNIKRSTPNQLVSNFVDNRGLKFKGTVDIKPINEQAFLVTIRVKRK